MGVAGRALGLPAESEDSDFPVFDIRVFLNSFLHFQKSPSLKFTATNVVWGYGSSLTEVELNYTVVTVVFDLTGTAYQVRTSCAIETAFLFSSFF